MKTDFEPGSVRRAIVREGLSFVAHGLMLPLGLRRPRHEPRRERDLRTLVFVHGLAANRSGFLPLQGYLRFNGFDRQLAFNYRSAGSIEAHALLLKQFLTEHVRGGRIDLITHSLGGLVARYYLQALGGARRVDRLITLGTPHHGSHAANFIPSRFVRQLLPEGPFIQHLNALPVPEGLQVTSIAAGRDLLVQPVDSSHCPFGEVVHFEDMGHVELLFRPLVMGEVLHRLDQPVSRDRSMKPGTGDDPDTRSDVRHSE